jgi:SAM-dependent methyltransferase
MNTAQPGPEHGHREASEDQAALWNGVAGRTWVEAQELLDRLFEPFEKLLAEEVVSGSKRSVLDVGCGTGATTLAIARSLGASGRSMGVDISEPMIALARARAARERVPAVFVAADAQSHAFEAESFDMIVSRFGVMFFDDPVQAFRSLRHAAADEAALSFVAWRGPAENPFMTTAERAAAPLLPDLPPRRADAPGQFAFADGDRVRAILEEAGWSAIDIQALDVECTLSEHDLDGYLTRMGPVGQRLPELDESARTRVVQTVRGAFAPYVHGAEVRFTAACWMVGARAPARK